MKQKILMSIGVILLLAGVGLIGLMASASLQSNTVFPGINGIWSADFSPSYVYLDSSTPSATFTYTLSGGTGFPLYMVGASWMVDGQQVYQAYNDQASSFTVNGGDYGAGSHTISVNIGVMDTQGTQDSVQCQGVFVVSQVVASPPPSANPTANPSMQPTYPATPQPSIIVTRPSTSDTGIVPIQGLSETQRYLIGGIGGVLSAFGALSIWIARKF